MSVERPTGRAGENETSPVRARTRHRAGQGLRARAECDPVTVRRAERLVAGTAVKATPGDSSGRFHGDRSQPALG
jgi:hypothetical protein